MGKVRDSYCRPILHYVLILCTSFLLLNRSGTVLLILETKRDNRIHYKLIMVCKL